MIHGRLTVFSADGLTPDELAQKFAEGAVDLAISELTVAAEDELVRHDLRPQLIEAVGTPATAETPPDGRTGPIVRVHATRPAQEE